MWFAFAFAGSLAPSEAELRGEVEDLADVRACRRCHREQHRGWEGSAHAQASLVNPWYRVSFEAVREAEGERATRHCAGCHDPVLLFSGVIDAGAAVDHPDAELGVTCLVCHGIDAAEVTGNASYTIDLVDLPDPRQDLEAHRARMLHPALEDRTVCASCHRGFLTTALGIRHFTPGLDDWGAWQSSAWAGNDSRRLDPMPRQRTCVDCHLGPDRDHGMLGGRTALAGDRLGRMQAQLAEALLVAIPVATVDGIPTVLDGSFAPPAGSEVVLDVAIRNVGVGHRFPGGVGDLQRTWVEVEVAGQTSPPVHLRSLVLDDDGLPELLHRPNRMATAAFDHTIPPGEVQLVRVALKGTGAVLAPVARVVHEPHRAELHAEACAVAPGICEVVRSEVATGGVRTDFDALYAHALGVARGVQEDLALAVPSLAAARERAEGRELAALDALEARIHARAGRTRKALAAADAAEARVGPHPSLERVRGEALARVWRWDEAAVHFQAWTDAHPTDPASWAALAQARVALGAHREALEATEHGLALDPRLEDLLRSRALALRGLEHPDADEAEARWLEHRARDDAPDLRARCDRDVPECSERAPIPVVRLRSGR